MFVCVFKRRCVCVCVCVCLEDVCVCVCLKEASLAPSHLEVGILSSLSCSYMSFHSTATPHYVAGLDIIAKALVTNFSL